MALGTPSTHGDPLERAGSRQVVVVATVVVAVAGFLVSVVSAMPEKLPGVALESALLLHMERSLVIAGAVAGALIFVLRGWAGYFPAKLSASGAEYAERSAVVEEAWNEKEILDALADMDAKHLALARSLSEEFESLRCHATANGPSDRGEGHDRRYAV